MSKIGKRPIELPAGVSTEIEGHTVKVSGPKGVLQWQLPPSIKLDREEGKLSLKRSHDTAQLRALHGLSRALIANMVKGVSEGFEKKLKIVGVGYRADPTGTGLRLSLGFSHPIEFTAPPGVQLMVDKNIIAVSGIDKQQVGETAARIRSLRKPEPYKGKGIMYIDERIRRKPGKAAKAVGGGAAAGGSS